VEFYRLVNSIRALSGITLWANSAISAMKKATLVPKKATLGKKFFKKG